MAQLEAGTRVGTSTRTNQNFRIDDLVGAGAKVIGPIRRSFCAAIGNRDIPGIFVALVVGPKADAQPKLPEIVDAGGVLALVLGLGKRGKQKSGQDGNDGDNDKKLDQRKSALPLLALPALAAMVLSAGNPHRFNFTIRAL